MRQWGFVMGPHTEHTECFPAQIGCVWTQRVTLRMCKESGPKDGDMLESRGPLHGAYPSKVGSDNIVVCYGNEHAKPKPIYLRCLELKSAGPSRRTPAAKPTPPRRPWLLPKPKAWP